MTDPTAAARQNSLQPSLNDNPFIAEKQRTRFSEIDLLKAIAIIAVVFIHCISDMPFGEVTAIQAFIGDWTRFAVPWFLFCAGFLFTKKRELSILEVLGKSATRLLPPYWVCSAFWILVAFTTARNVPSFGTIAKSLFYAETHGIYYFVFVIAYLYFLGSLLRYLQPKWIVGIWVASLLLLVCNYITWPAMILPNGSMKAAMRSPFVHCFPFLTGWLASVHYGVLRSKLRDLNRTKISLLCLADVALLTILTLGNKHDMTRELLIQSHVYILLALTLRIGITHQLDSRTIRFLSESSYGIYLTHVLFLPAIHYTFRRYNIYDLPGRIFISAVVALILTTLFLLMIKAISGSRSRLLVGV